jgi:hypothetical protein
MLQNTPQGEIHDNLHLMRLLGEQYTAVPSAALADEQSLNHGAIVLEE